MANSAPVTANVDTATAKQYVDLRLDVLDPLTGHIHDNVNGRAHGDSDFVLRNPADTFSYTFRTAAIAAARDLTLPLLTGTDTLMVLSLHQATQAAIEAETNEDTYVPPDLIKNSPGVAKVYASITAAGVLESGSSNVDSVTDTGTGDRTIVISTDFSGATYTVAGHMTVATSGFLQGGTRAVGSFRIGVVDAANTALTDIAHSAVAFGDQ